ncbi:MAG: glycoside hydrolase family 3 [Prosthecochloris sp.]|uniref:glycoside hydrolase family 3 protein n=1 Tax=Prosthecochloris sp. TaxID=290513 RepID=UPI0013C9E260|nr:glycoside hydrolase family 3 protein [Prosthecochloris sp.]NEX11271.1 glycoside hydrolase family 3 [Prosthecochloris sp.]
MKKKTLLSLLVLLITNILSACASNQLAEDVIDAKIGRMIMVGFRGMSIEEAPWIIQDIRNQRVGGVILFDYDVPAASRNRNIASPDQLAALTRQLQQCSPEPLLIAIDQEGGMVSRLKHSRGFPESISAAHLGTINDPDSTCRRATTTANTLRSMHINLNFAPVVDVNTNPDNPVIGKLERSFSSDPATVAVHAATTVKAMHEQGIHTALKHFPGHGSSTTDTHKDFTDVTTTWTPKELEPYRALIKEGYRDFIMTAHVFNAQLDPDYPATLSQKTITGMLRDSLGFRGAVISDDMQMQAIAAHYGLETAIRLALDAGVDILLFANNSTYDPDIGRKTFNIIRTLVENGTISRERIEKSWERINKLQHNHSLAEQ